MHVLLPSIVIAHVPLKTLYFKYLYTSMYKIREYVCMLIGICDHKVAVFSTLRLTMLRDFCASSMNSLHKVKTVTYICNCKINNIRRSFYRESDQAILGLCKKYHYLSKKPMELECDLIPKLRTLVSSLKLQ